MAQLYHHAISSSNTFGGGPEEDQATHDWFDQTKAHLPDVRHRALLHSSFGTTLRLASGKQVPVRLIGEQHVKEDMGGMIPTVQD